MKRFAICLVALSAVALGMFSTVQAQQIATLPAPASSKVSLIGAWEETKGSGTYIFYFMTNGRFHCYGHQNRMIQSHIEGSYQYVNGTLTVTSNGMKVECRLDTSVAGKVTLNSNDGKISTTLVKLVGDVRLSDPQGATVILSN